MPIEARQRFPAAGVVRRASSAGLSVRLSMTAGSFGFSTNCWISRSSLTRMSPRPSTCAAGTGIAAIVTSAPVAMCCAMILRKSIR